MLLVRFISSAVIAAVLFSACDIPTELPKWDTTWVVKSESTTLSVAQLLPGPSIALTNNSSAFALSLNPSSFSESLGALCGACALLNGQTAPKPPFAATFSTSISLPSDVTATVLTAGTVNLTLRNGFSFDPLRPSATARGSITIAIRTFFGRGTSGHDSTTIATRTISGVDQSLPAGNSLQVAVPLQPDTIIGSLVVRTTVDSPAGDATTINTADQLSVTATPTGLIVSSAQLSVHDRNVTAVSVVLDVNDVDGSIRDHIKGGALLLSIDNPFGVTGNLNLTITGGTEAISKPVVLQAGQSTAEVPFTAAELRSFIGLGAGRTITLSITGPVGSLSLITVKPSQVLTVSTQLKLIIGPQD